MKNKFAFGMLVVMLIVGMLSVFSVGATPVQAADALVPVSEVLPSAGSSTQASNVGKYCSMAAGGAGLRTAPTSENGLPFIYLQLKTTMLIVEEVINSQNKVTDYKLSKIDGDASLVAWAKPAQCPLLPGQ